LIEDGNSLGPFKNLKKEEYIVEVLRVVWGGWNGSKTIISEKVDP
jgi:hypothetical protein